MSSWRVLRLSEQPEGEPIPQLLVKPAFDADSYIVHVTCLTNIWSEELHLSSIVHRAAELQSPIEVSIQDTSQLAILLDNVKNSLQGSDHVDCRLTRQGSDAITLHTTIPLPEPLDSLTWKFHLQKRTAVTLKNELILPLLVSSHIQYERINDLVTTIENKDKAITRMVDQFESSNLDLAAAFPSIGGLKAGRNTIKREQAARHLPALRPFQQHVWREETAQLTGSDVTTLGLFQEALAQCTPHVPPTLEADEGAEEWLSAVPTRLTSDKPAVRIKPSAPVPVFQPPKHGHESSGDDTEDEFEVHENFKTRRLSEKTTETLKPTPPLPQQTMNTDDDDDSTEDDGDLDAPSQGRSQSQSQVHSRTPQQTAQRTKSPSPKAPPRKSSSPPAVAKTRGKGFRIGGRSRKVTPEPSQEQHGTIAQVEADRESLPPSSQIDTQIGASPRKPRKPFRIGGKNKTDAESAPSPDAIAANINHCRDANLPAPNLSPPSVQQQPAKEEAPREEVREETSEKKAERKRAELKRRNEEIAKKQAQNKKKKRF